MFLLDNNRATILKVKILYMFLMIRGYLLVFFIRTYFFMLIWFIEVLA